MRLKNQSKFHIKGLNQEKFFNEISKHVSLWDIDRKSKTQTTFSCSYFDRKKVEKALKASGVEYSVTHEGFCHNMQILMTSYGLLAAILLSFCLYFFQFQYVLLYEINGTTILDKACVVEFLKESYSNKKSKIDTEEIEIGLLENFEEISFASCIVKGQALIVNIKEKLMPEEMYGQFQPIVATASGKIKEIHLVSGTSKVSVGDFVQAGDVLIEPYTIDTSGQIKKVEAEAEILAEVYCQGSVDHYESYIDVSRTGRVAEENNIKLFGLNIYSFKEEMNFEMYEVEFEEIDLSQKLILPFKIHKTIYYELSERFVESKFEDVKDEFVEKAKAKALENCKNCDNIIEEFYTLRHLSGVTIVNYCLVTLEQIGGIK